MRNNISDKVPQAYILFARAFGYPEPASWGERDNLLTQFQRIGAPGLSDIHVTVTAESLEQLGAEYVSYFDVGNNGIPPCPLYEGLHRKDEDRVGIIMELLRFYSFFGLKLSQSCRDYPDHLSTELEFMGYLSSGEACADSEAAAHPFQFAQRDFLDRHLRTWLPLLRSRMEQSLKGSLYCQLCSALVEFIKGEQTRLNGCLQGGGE